MQRNDSQRSQAHHHSHCRRWRHDNATFTVIVTAFALTLAVCAWLALVFNSKNPVCWQEWQGRPVSASSFPWEGAALLPQAPAWTNYSVSSEGDMSLRNIVFGIAGSARLWPKRKEYVKLWWRPQEMVGFVCLEEKIHISEDEARLLPQVLVSEDISRFRYTHSTGHPSGVRIARIVQEIFKLGLPDVKWFVLGDDDTIFSPDNLLQMLTKYDHNEMYYIGHPSETHSANTEFSHDMAFGGGGIAISYPLASTLSSMLDDCLERYPSLFGSDDRLHACITELGVPLTREDGFHQFDIHGDPFGLLAAHPVSPFISIHHLDEVDPVLPGLNTLDAMKRLSVAMRAEPSSFLQQCVCYDHAQKLSISISMGYVVQVFPNIILPRELEKPEITFKAWSAKDQRKEFALDTRRYLRSICLRPFLFFLEDIHKVDSGLFVSIYKRDSAVDERKRHSFCFSRVFPPEEVEQIQVLSKPLSDHWFAVPQRQCCKLMGVEDKMLKITVAPCQHGQG